MYLGSFIFEITDKKNLLMNVKLFFPFIEHDRTCPVSAYSEFQYKILVSKS